VLTFRIKNLSKLFKELDYQNTPLGNVSLRRRRQLKLNKDVYEVILNDEHLMSNLFIASEVALAKVPLDEIKCKFPDILVGGLGLGYTAKEVLSNKSVKSLTIIEYLEPVISWHKQGILPIKKLLFEDPRCHIILADFFKSVFEKNGFDPNIHDRKFDGIFLDIDHAPDFYLNSSHAKFYTIEGMEKVLSHLNDNGLFSLWSNNPLDINFVDLLKNVFEMARAEKVIFYNPILEEDCTQTIYIAKK
jgi:spermidine synthase